MEFFCLEERIGADNEVKLIDLFVDSLDFTAYAHLVEANKQRMEENYELYRQQQMIVEHPFGIIKRQWGFYYIMTKKTMKRASADVGPIFSAYNLRRIFNILPKEELKAYLKELLLFFAPFYRNLQPICRLQFPPICFSNIFSTALKSA